MSSSGNITPISETFEGFDGREASEALGFRSGSESLGRSTPTPIKKFKSCLNKISERNYPKISDEMLTIHLLDEPESSESKPTDKEAMLPVIETFMANVCVFERNIEAINFYTKTFCKLKDNWKGRQGRVLTENMMKRVCQCIQAGEPSAAYRMLTEIHGLARKTEDNVQKLKGYFPNQVKAITPREIFTNEEYKDKLGVLEDELTPEPIKENHVVYKPYEIQQDKILHYINDCPKTKAPGFDGLRPRHLMQMIVGADAHPIRKQFLELLKRLIDRASQSHPTLQ
jgi:hypothetical protein